MGTGGNGASHPGNGARGYPGKKAQFAGEANFVCSEVKSSPCYFPREIHGWEQANCYPEVRLLILLTLILAQKLPPLCVAKGTTRWFNKYISRQ